MQFGSQGVGDKSDAANDFSRLPMLPPKFWLVVGPYPGVGPVFQLANRSAVKAISEYIAGASKVQNPKAEAADFNDWHMSTALSSASKAKTATLALGSDHLSPAYKNLCLSNNCGLCAVCHKLSDDAAILISTDVRGKDVKDKDKDARWMRNSGIQPYFTKDNPGNALILCQWHKELFRDYDCCFVPSTSDLQALIDFEVENMKRRKRGSCPYRLVPLNAFLSGWYEYLPLNTSADGSLVGHYDIVVTGTEEEGLQFRYDTTLPDGQHGFPTCYYEEEEKAMMVWLGLSDVSPQVLARHALSALQAVRYPLPARYKTVMNMLRELLDLYQASAPPPPTTLPKQDEVLTSPSTGSGFAASAGLNFPIDLQASSSSAAPVAGPFSGYNTFPETAGTSSFAMAAPLYGFPDPGNGAYIYPDIQDIQDQANRIQWGTMGLAPQPVPALNVNVAPFANAYPSPVPNPYNPGAQQWRPNSWGMNSLSYATGYDGLAAPPPGPSAQMEDDAPDEEEEEKDEGEEEEEEEEGGDAATPTTPYVWIVAAHAAAERARKELDAAIAVHLDKKRTTDMRDEENGNNDSQPVKKPKLT